jgi:Domain of unknown function (DUF4115)
MWVILVVVVVVVVGVALVAVQRRPKGSDLTSVRKYHSALGTIEQLSDRIGKAPVRVVGGDGPAGGDAGAGINAGGRRGGADQVAGEVGSSDAGPLTGSPPGPNRRYPPVSGGEPNGWEAPLVFDDAHPDEHRWRDGSAQGPSRSRTDRAQRHALDSMNRRPRRGVTVMIVVLALATFAVLAFLGSRRTDSAGHGHTVAASTSTVRATHSTSSSVSDSGGSHQGGHAGKHGAKTKPTPTTLPPQIVATSTGPGVATFSAPAASYSVTVTASGPCWVLARTVSSGSTLWTGTLQAGASQTVQATGAITVELGAASATLDVDNVPVVLPTPLDTPFVATFLPGTTGATPSGSPTATATTTPSAFG